MAERGEREAASAQPISIGVLMACFNRSAVTLKCLELLFAQSAVLDGDVSLAVWLLDDGTDGTGLAAAALDPRVHVIQGDGTYFYGGGMAAARDATQQAPPDLYLWLNDDVMLDEDALELLLAERRAIEESGFVDPVLSGPQRDLRDMVQYSGRRFERTRPWMTTTYVLPSGTAERVDLIPGNCILVSTERLDAADPFDGVFQHGWLDWHFAMKVNAIGGSTWIASRSVGICPRGLPTWIDPEIPASKAVRSFVDRARNGVVLTPPIRFYRRYAGVGWPVNVALLVSNRVRVGMVPRVRAMVTSAGRSSV